MNILTSAVIVALATSFAISASLPETPERKDNVIVLEVASSDAEESKRDGKTSSKNTEAEGDRFEIVVPIARNFSSIEELFRILREDNPKQPRGPGGTPPTYVKGTEGNSSEYVFLFADDIATSNSSS